MSLENLDAEDLKGMKVGVYWDFFSHADKEIVDKCKVALTVLESLGAERVIHHHSRAGELSSSTLCEYCV